MWAVSLLVGPTHILSLAPELLPCMSITQSVHLDIVRAAGVTEFSEEILSHLGSMAIRD